MTAFVPDVPLRVVATEAGARSLRIEIEGVLDFRTADTLVTAVCAQLEAHPGAGDLELVCTEMGLCDSAGLSALLMIRRRTAAAGAHLRLTDRSPQLDRLLNLTGTMHHLTGEAAAVGEGHDRELPQQ
ncbi:STAS domain-containing protein [Actinomadura bangladeshensis]|jgi:anti-anti-sigma factor|uniref:STAS domain-containing protein n=1 Tax=Actinomadura bangladeshensis TaxID=453573 RepID=A0A6L9QTN5_9ACTN|nr:STAS domain-containing protein [Actinomadura bangladeshensis]NEA28751.1 STAS domain-containing protein [Actinomadura bangladeshensis]